jgi:hypothetical protein
MQITRGTANPSWRWTDVRDDHQGVALILDDGRRGRLKAAPTYTYLSVGAGFSQPTEYAH